MKKVLLGPVVGAALVLLFTGGAANAAVEEGGGSVPPVSDAPMGTVAVRRGVQGPEGLVTLRLLLLVNASEGAFGKPTSLAPDLYYSLTDTVQIGLLHTLPMGWQTEPGAGLCLTGKSGGCPHLYDNVGFDLMYGLLYGDFHLSLHSSLYFFHISDPLGTMWTVGLTGKFHFTDLVALFFDPQIGITLSNRSIYKDQLFLPLELQFQAAPAVSIKILSGVTGQLSALGDTVRSPLGLGIVANLTPHLDLGLRFSFDNLLGHQAPMTSRTDERSIGVLLNVRS
ncbi:MAG TPA: hypothetical protein VLA14_14595 [Polyangia bacterium]|jgi:hypothetical protein|nr:hypothetical protein [Polyangia bacterium]